MTNRIIVAVKGLLMPLHIACYLLSENRRLVSSDVDRWSEILWGRKPMGRFYRLWRLVELISEFREFRNLFYFRIGFLSGLLKVFFPGLESLIISVSDLGPGLFIQHGIGTIITAKKIGARCWINQGVTIGWTESGGPPELGDDVRVGAGAKVLGALKIGNGARIGANAVVLKDVPDNATAVGVPARLVFRSVDP